MDKILLFSGANSNRRSTMACKMKFDKRTGVYVKVCAKKRRARKKGLFGGIGDLGETKTRGARARSFLMLGGLSIPQLLYTGSLGALGAIGSSYIWKKIGKSLNITDTTMIAIAEMATGAGIALICIKLLKQPKLGAALALGPIIVGLRDIIKPMIPASWGLTGIEGFRGIPMVSRSGLKTYPMSLPGRGMGSIPQVGTGIPQWTKYPTSASFMGAV